MKNKIFIIFILLLCVIIPFSGCKKKKTEIKAVPTPVPTAVPALDKIIYTSNGSLYWIDRDGNSKQELFPDGKSKWFPSVSPDGWTIAYWVHQNGYFNLWTGNLKNNRATQITFDRDSLEGDTTNLKMSNPGGWTADSSEIIYSRRKNIWKINRDGYNPVALTDTHDCVSPSLSKDNKLIYIKIENENTSNIYSREKDFINETRLTNYTNKKAASPSFSPDGKKIVFTLFEGETSNIAVHDIASGKTENITLDGKSHSPVYSYDGKDIVFVNFINNKYIPEIWIMRPDGTNRMKISDESGGVSPYWLHRILDAPLPTYTPTPASADKTLPAVVPGNKTVSQPVAVKTLQTTAAPIKATVKKGGKVSANIVQPTPTPVSSSPETVATPIRAVPNKSTGAGW
ncbi:MAG: PD40 domain-containing protein [Candidatus Goldbacteria bacterium]|nr:PD40 domain-containing protein [Candidatus Goldiibacteriota bacterium]